MEASVEEVQKSFTTRLFVRTKHYALSVYQYQFIKCQREQYGGEKNLPKQHNTDVQNR